MFKCGLGPAGLAAASNSPFNYPLIPRRSSSLRAASSAWSGESVISRRNSSLDDSPWELRLSKPRRVKKENLSDPFITGPETLTDSAGSGDVKAMILPDLHLAGD